MSGDAAKEDDAPPSPSVFAAMNVNIPPRLRRVLERTRSSGDVLGSRTPPPADGGETPSPIRLRRVVSAASARSLRLSFHDDADHARSAVEAEAEEVLGGAERPAAAAGAAPVLPPMAASESPAVPVAKRRPASAASRGGSAEEVVKKLTLDGVRALTPPPRNDGTPARGGPQPALVRRPESGRPARVKTPVGVEPAHGLAVEAEADAALPSPATPSKASPDGSAAAAAAAAAPATPASVPPRAVPGVVASPAVGVRPESRGTESSGTGLAERIDFGPGGVRVALHGQAAGSGDSQRRLERFFDGVVGSPPPSPQVVSREVEDRELWNVDDDDDARGRSSVGAAGDDPLPSSTVTTADEDASVVDASGDANALGLAAETSASSGGRAAVTVPDPPIDRDSVSSSSSLSAEHVAVDIVDTPPPPPAAPAVRTPPPAPLPAGPSAPTDARAVSKGPWIAIFALLILFLGAVVALIIVSV